VLLVMTAGIADTYTIARGNRTQLYTLHYRKPEQLVPRRDVHEVRERLDWDGSVLTPLQAEDFQPIIDKVQSEGIEAVAVCFLHSYVNPAHELQAREILQAALPHVPVSLSHEVACEWREYERASSAVMDAYIAPVVSLYLKTLKQDLLAANMDKTIHVMRSNGGVMTDSAASRHPVSTLLSGPVGGSIGGVQLSADTGRPNLLCVDMGGTSFDLSLVMEGRAQVSTETVLEGLPLLMPVVNIDTVGTGGGSLAWLENGSLRVGPKSAGSVPGPVCYGRGGTQPTVTDANLYLGRLGTNSLLDGKMSLDTAAAAKSIAGLASEINLDTGALAEGILAISNAKMADAMRTITVKQGIDPRQFTLVAFGGAGPMHAVELARELEISEVLIPRFPGTFSAWGMLQSDIRHDFSTAYFTSAQAAEIDEIRKICDEMKADGTEVLTGEGVSPEDRAFSFSVDVRYIGQEFSLSVPFGETTAISEICEIFHGLHEKRFGHAMPESPAEFVNLRLAALGHLPQVERAAPAAGKGGDPVIGQRDVVFGNSVHTAPVLKRNLMTSTAPTSGPAIIEEESATTVIPPGYVYRLDEIGNIIITAEAAP
jgi:N-methylhydantoinase A